LYGLTSQVRKAAVSVASNIAEACGRSGDLDFRRFIQMALGSASEAEYQMLLARDLGYMETTSHDEIQMTFHRVKRMLSRLRDRSVKGPSSGQSFSTADGRRPTADG
jgi:four helix bundle protein